VEHETKTEKNHDGSHSHRSHKLRMKIFGVMSLTLIFAGDMIDIIGE